MKSFKIAFSNIRKRKSSAITLFVITVLAALMLSMSFSIVFNINSFYDNKRIELNTPDYSAVVPIVTWQDEMLTYSENYKGVTAVEVTDGYMAMGNIKFTAVSDDSIQVMFFNAEQQNSMNTYEILEKLDNKPANSILLSLQYKYSGIKVGQKFPIQIGNDTVEYIVYGFFEDAQLGSTLTSVSPVYIPSDNFNDLENNPFVLPFRYLSLQFEDTAISSEFGADLLQHFGVNDLVMVPYHMTRMAATMFPLIMGMVLILVSAVVVAIALIVVSFSIKNNLQEEIKTLGALKSVGFTSKQLIASTILQFTLIAIVGGLVGVTISMFTNGFVGNIISSTSGLLWSSSATFLPSLLSLVLIVLVTMLVTLIASRKTKNVTPINAMRSGLSNHSFKKNVVAMEKSHLSLNANIAVKNAVLNKKNNIVALILVFLFSTLVVLTSVLYHNFVTEKTAFSQMIGLETAELQVSTSDGNLATQYFEEIKNHPNVEKTLEMDTSSLMVDGKSIIFSIWEDINAREVSTIVKGRYPQNDNEIVLPAIKLKELNKNIGDVVTITYKDKTESYIITGTTQGVGDTSELGDMTYEGFSRLEENRVLVAMYVYLINDDPASIEATAIELINKFGRDIYVVNFSENLKLLMASIEQPVAIAVYLVMAITVFVVCFVLFLMISTIIRQRKKDFGVMKALGFTSKQIIAQMLLSFLPIIVVGILVGTIVGILATNPLLGVMFASSGIAKAMFTVPIALVLICEIVLAVVCILTVVLVSLKTKRISAHKLIAD